MSNTSPIILEEMFAPGCHTCKAFEMMWETIKGNFPQVELRRVDITSERGQELIAKYMIFASPALIINGELFSTGGFDKEKLITKLNVLSHLS